MRSCGVAALAATLQFAGARSVVAQEATRFEIVAPSRMSAQNGATLTLEADGSVRVGGAVAATESLTFELLSDKNEITGLRIEALADKALPASGPGLAPNGNFVLSEIVVEQAPRNSDGFKPVLLERPTADFEQQGCPVVAAIDGAPRTGWAIWPNVGAAHEAVFETQRNLGFDAGVKLRVRLDFLFGGQHVAGRIRLALTTASRPLKARRDDAAANDAQGRVPLAIQRGTRWLLEQQELDGLWESRAADHRHGMTALAGYTLVKCGVSKGHPSLQRAATRIACEPPSSTYSAGMELMFLCELPDDALLPRIEETTRRLLSWQQGGGFGYPAGAPDLSNGQYAALGLRAAARRGVKIPPDAWLRLGDATLAYQEKAVGEYAGAGFGYHPGGEPTGSMTAGGTCVMKIVDEQLAALGPVKTAYSTSWRRGVAWLDRHFAPDLNARRGGEWLYYWLYGVERVGGLCDVAELAGKSWYREGARVIVGAQKADGSWDNDGGPQPTTCFALLFLARATSSVSGVAVRSENLYGDDDPARDVNVRASGDTPLTMWISSFGDPAKTHEWPGEEGQGPRVVDVRYVVPGRTLLADARDDPGPWRMSEVAPAGAFERPGFDDAAWKRVPGAFGDPRAAGVPVRTESAAPELWLRREFTVDDAPLLSPELRVAAPAPPPPPPPSAPLVCLFDEETAFAGQLREASEGGTVAVRETGAANGRCCLDVRPRQVFSAALPGWRLPIAEEPRPGEFRWLRFTWRKEGAGGLMIQLARNGVWDGGTIRFHAGDNELKWASTSLANEAPRQWHVETVDLFTAFGGATTLTGLALVAMGGGVASFDAFYLARSPADFEAIPRSTNAHASVARVAATDVAPPVAGDAVAAIELFLNGTLVWQGDAATAGYLPVPTLLPLAQVLKPGKNLLAAHVRRGASIAAFDVTLLDQRLLATVAGDPTKPARTERFAAQWSSERNGAWPIRALARVALPPGGPAAELLLGSPLLDVTIREARDAELLGYAGDAGRNLLGPGNAVATASSRLNGGFEPAFAVDNLAARGWLCADGDQRPTLSIELKKPARADTLLVAPIQQRAFEDDRKRWKVRRVEVAIDRGKGGTFELALPADGRKGVLRLTRPIVFRRLDLRIVDTSDLPPTKSAVGLGEVELVLRK